MLSLALASCNMPAAATATQDPSVALTTSAQAVQVQLTQTALFITPAPSESPTLTPSVTNTPGTIPTTAVPTLAPGLPSATPVCNQAQFVKDQTVPDGTIYSPGVTFVKTWRLKNVGTCTWTTNYVLIFDHGKSMGPSGNQPAPVPLPTSVAPGQTVDVSITLTTPPSPGNYQADFRLRSDAGIVFGIGPSSQGTFWVKIVVLPGTSYP